MVTLQLSGQTMPATRGRLVQAAAVFQASAAVAAC